MYMFPTIKEMLVLQNMSTEIKVEFDFQLFTMNLRSFKAQVN